jgi:acetylornithine deacetylase
MSGKFAEHSTSLGPADLLGELIRIPSTYEHEHAILAFVESYLTRLGVSFTRVPYDPVKLRSLPGALPPFSSVEGRYCLVAKYTGRGQGPALVLNCHLDVVPAGPPETWTHPPFSGYVDESKVIFGRGAMDNKAGVALALTVLERLVVETIPLSGDLVVQFVLEDEITGNGTLLCLDSHHAGDAAIILDGTRGETAINKHAGNLQFAVKVSGRPASVSVSHMGLNAAEALFELLLRLRCDVLALNEGRPAPWTQFPSPNQFSTQSVSSVDRPLTVPDHAEAQCYMTFTPPHTVQSMRRRIEDAVQQFAAQRGVPAIAVQWEGCFFTEVVDSNATALENAMQIVAQSLGRPPLRFVPSTGTSDMRHFVARGIPCILFGPGRGFNPHRADEHFHLEDLNWMTAMLLGIVRHWTSPDAVIRDRVTMLTRSGEYREAAPAEC